MRNHKKLLSLLLALVMMLQLIPMSVYAVEEYVYISVSYDGEYVEDKNGEHIAYVAIPMDEVTAVDLNDYNLGEYLYDEDGDGSYETTALQMVIYAHENLFGGSWDDVTFTGAPGSSYFQGGIFGFDENLNYYLNGEYPLASAGWGATSDQIVLEAGDYLDIASFSSWDFYGDSNYGFHFFADENGDFTHSYTAKPNEEMTVKLVRSFSGMGADAAVYDEADYTVYYGTAYGSETGSVTTDGSGEAVISFPSAGQWILWCDGGYGLEYPDDIVSSPAYAKVTVSAPAAPETPREAQDVSEVLDATMAQMAETVTAPAFGTDAGEWTVLSLARGGYYDLDSTYFADYYDRIVETVNETAASVNLSGALHKNKSTENSRLIVALSALGKDATAVGDWDLIEAYDANGLTWIQKQGLNGAIWALIALDSNNYETDDATLRQQCIDAILAAQHDDGGWSLMANTALASDPDITGMALQALYPYRSQSAVAAAAEEAFACLSDMQQDDGSFISGGDKCAESCAWVIVSTTAWGINPDTDSRFIKNGNSVVDALLAHYLEEEAAFQHIIGAGVNAMATDQACYALVAYDRFINEETALFDFSDVTFETPAVPSGDEITVSLGLPAKVKVTAGTEFNAVISVDRWDNEAGYKLIDFIMNIPEGFIVTDVTPGSRLAGGEVDWYLEEDTGKLRVVYFDAYENNSLTMTGNEFPAELFTIGMQVVSANVGDTPEFSIGGMSIKLSSDSSDADAMIVVNTASAIGTIEMVKGLSVSAVCLYTGDDVDLISSDEKAVAVAVTGIQSGALLTYDDGEGNAFDLIYSPEISLKTGIDSYIALVDASIPMTNFADTDNYIVDEDELTGMLEFGDSNFDGVVNAQDALNAVSAWLRRGDAPEGDEILVLNVNGDSRINTFDALGIVEAFVNSSEFGVVLKAATLTPDTETE